MEDVKMKVRVRVTGPLSFCTPGNLTLYMQIIILSKLTHNFGTAYCYNHNKMLMQCLDYTLEYYSLFDY